jgi:hypothetical protein
VVLALGDLQCSLVGHHLILKTLIKCLFVPGVVFLVKANEGEF